MRRYYVNKIRKKLFVSICMVVVTLMAVCTILQIDTKMTLYGVVNEVSFPQFDWESVLDGEWQAQIDEWYKSNFPLRPC